MRNLRNVEISGEKLGHEDVTKDNKTSTTVHMLVGYESVKVTTRDAGLANKLKSLPNRKELRLKVEIQSYKDNLYLTALELVG
ncbi:MAG: hypothetical protein N2645_06810 [Clostridia bacterium]|nr:hypothetical protein [Clostridia bacterium]